MEGIPFGPVAEQLARPGVWFVTAGYDNSTTRQLMCRYPLVLASPLEGFRLHYVGDFLRERAGPAELRSVSAAMGPRALIDLAAAHNSFLDEGWALPEGFRWAVGKHASVTFPRWGQRNRTVLVRVMPMVHA